MKTQFWVILDWSDSLDGSPTVYRSGHTDSALTVFESKREAQRFAAQEICGTFDSFTHAKRLGWVDVVPLAPLKTLERRR